MSEWNLWKAFEVKLQYSVGDLECEQTAVVCSAADLAALKSECSREGVTVTVQRRVSVGSAAALIAEVRRDRAKILNRAEPVEVAA